MYFSKSFIKAYTNISCLLYAVCNVALFNSKITNKTIYTNLMLCIEDTIEKLIKSESAEYFTFLFHH